MPPSAAATSPNAARVVLVDDEPNMVRIIGRFLQDEGYTIEMFEDPVAAIARIREDPPELVLTDLKMPGATGLDVLRAAKAASPATGIVVMTAHGSIEGAVEAMQAGAYHYVTKPLQMDVLIATLDRARHEGRLARENTALTETLRRNTGSPEFIGVSEAMASVQRLIAKIAPTDSAVLIEGESGTGKELAARAIHAQSHRSSKAFVAINCASIPETLLESELFGHEKGAFTGADRAKMGLMELAHGGTLFLDEIGELPLSLQAKLLRVLQEREIQRVGGLRPIPVDIRLLAATHRDLKAASDRREFRTDLYFRLNVISVRLPPLREHPEDIPVLARAFVVRHAQRLGRGEMTLAPEALALLEKYHFPGNVRELENIVERVVVLAAGSVIGLEDLPSDLHGSPALSRTAASASAGASDAAGNLDYRVARDDFERAYLNRIIELAGGNMTEAARLSGISRRNLYEKLEKLGIKPRG